MKELKTLFTFYLCGSIFASLILVIQQLEQKASKIINHSLTAKLFFHGNRGYEKRISLFLTGLILFIVGILELVSNTTFVKILRTVLTEVFPTELW